MGFLNWIIEELEGIRDWFYNFYQIVHDWSWPFYLIEVPVYAIYGRFVWLVTWFTDFKDWVLFAEDEIERILSIGQIMRMLKTWLDYAIWAWDWVVNASLNVVAIIQEWWVGALAAVKTLIARAEQALQDLISALDRRLTDLKAAVDALLDQLPSIGEIIAWFTDWWGNILTRLTAWWGERLVGINELIGSWFTDFEPFWRGWQEIRDKVFELFDDPEKWLMDMLERMLARFL